MNGQHTPGPWRVVQGGSQHPFHIKSTALPLAASAVVRMPAQTEHNMPANARLIAAAPELLLALQIARDVLVDLCNYEPRGDAVTAIDAAIAKATGATA